MRKAPLDFREPTRIERLRAVCAEAPPPKWERPLWETALSLLVRGAILAAIVFVVLVLIGALG